MPSNNITEELIEAARHLRDVVRTRDPPLGYIRGQAVGPQDRAARLIILNWLAEKFEDSLLTRLLREINPIATRRIFNNFLDGRMEFDDTILECVQRANDSGHEATALECCTTIQLLDEALIMVNSPFMVESSK
jgi:hypothetical protein